MKYRSLAFLSSIIILLLSMLLNLKMGSSSLSFHDIYTALFTSNATFLQQSIVWDIRLPRLLTAVLVGAGLSMCGAILQNVSRNPLADPYLFGLMAGAGLGATVVSLVLPAQVVSLALGAFAGSVFAVLLVFAVCALDKWRRMDLALLAGVAVSFMLSALSSFILYFSEPFAANQIMFWLMGSLNQTQWQSVQLLAPVVIGLLLLALALRRQLDVMLLSDETARSLGINVKRIRLLLLLATALTTACIVSQCGGIAFVGLMIPHIVRRVWGVTSVKLLIGSSVIGAIFMLWVDNLSRNIVPEQEIPLGIITSLVGSVFFLMIMRSKRF